MARALAWHARGRQFDSDILHIFRFSGGDTISPHSFSFPGTRKSREMEIMIKQLKAPLERINFLDQTGLVDE